MVAFAAPRSQPPPYYRGFPRLLQLERREDQRTDEALAATGRAVDLDGNSIKFKAVEELLAPALEHEADHLDGVLYIDHFRSKDDLFEVTEGEEEEGEGEARAKATAPAPAEM